MASWKPTKNFSRKCPDCGASLLVPTWPRCDECGKKLIALKSRLRCKERYYKLKKMNKEEAPKSGCCGAALQGIHRRSGYVITCSECGSYVNSEDEMQEKDIIMYATGDHGDGNVLKIGSYGDITDIKIDVGMFDPSVIISFDYKWYSHSYGEQHS